MNTIPSARTPEPPRAGTGPPWPEDAALNLNMDDWPVEYAAFAGQRSVTVWDITRPLPVMLSAMARVIAAGSIVRRIACGIATSLACESYCEFLEPRLGPPGDGVYDVIQEAGDAHIDGDLLGRYLALTLGLSAMLGDEPMLSLARAYFQIRDTQHHADVFNALLLAPATSWNASDKHDPGAFLRRAVAWKLYDEGRIRPGRARGQTVLSLDQYVENGEVAEVGIETVTPFVDNMLDLLHAMPGKKPQRLARIIARVRDGFGKADLGRADYEFLQANVDLLVRLLKRAGETPPAVAAETSHRLRMLPWYRERVAGMVVVSHRYFGEALERYGESVQAELLKSVQIQK